MAFSENADQLDDLPHALVLAAQLADPSRARSGRGRSTRSPQAAEHGEPTFLEPALVSALIALIAPDCARLVDLPAQSCSITLTIESTT